MLSDAEKPTLLPSSMVSPVTPRPHRLLAEWLAEQGGSRPLTRAKNVPFTEDETYYITKCSKERDHFYDSRCEVCNPDGHLEYRREYLDAMKKLKAYRYGQVSIGENHAMVTKKTRTMWTNNKMIEALGISEFHPVRYLTEKFFELNLSDLPIEVLKKLLLSELVHVQDKHPFWLRT